MKMKIQVVIWRSDGWHLGRAENLPGVLSQGKSPIEVAGNLVDAAQLMLADGGEPGPDDLGVPVSPSKPPSLEASVDLPLPGGEGLEEGGDEPR